jgi:deoxyribonuclease V
MPDYTLPALPDLPETAGSLVRQVPAGRVTTFGDVATALGDVRAARWVAEAVASGELASAEAPVHRLVRKTGELTGALPAQRRQLLAEGCPFLPNGSIDVAAAQCHVVSHIQPLAELRAWQSHVAAAPDPARAIDVPASLGGVDLSYPSPREAVAAYVSVNVATGAVRFAELLRRNVRFPYIPGYLTFREAPVLLELLAEVRTRQELDPVILVDGTGRLHPRRAGIAVALGLLAGCVTVGVSKHQLCGCVAAHRVEQCAAIEEAGETVGAVLEGGSRRRTLFVSPGFGIDLPSAIRCTQAVWRLARLPLPLFHADRLSRQAART